MRACIGGQSHQRSENQAPGRVSSRKEATSVDNVPGDKNKIESAVRAQGQWIEQGKGRPPVFTDDEDSDASSENDEDTGISDEGASGRKENDIRSAGNTGQAASKHSGREAVQPRQQSMNYEQETVGVRGRWVEQGNGRPPVFDEDSDDGKSGDEGGIGEVGSDDGESGWQEDDSLWQATQSIRPIVNATDTEDDSTLQTAKGSTGSTDSFTISPEL
jgi:hypothetical protein